jgi:hypothetical protein
MQRRWVKAMAVVAALVFVVFVLIPHFINADALRP